MDERLLKAKNVIFDIGNVLLRFDENKVCALLPEGIRQDVQKAMFTPVNGRSLWQRFDLGVPSNEENAKDIAAAAGHPGCEEHILYALEHFPFSMEALPLSETIPALKEMGKRIFALTNYPEPSLTRTLRHFPFFADMDGLVVSAREHLMKPDPAIFRLILDRYGLDPAETLFIDDSEPNARCAASLGMAAWHYRE